MSTEYEVQQGDCISSIAEREGFFWETLWAANPDLKQVREDPNRLLPGDVVIIPDKEKDEVSCAAEQKHSFKKKGTPAKLKILLEEDSIPLKNESYVLKVDGEIIEGQTNGDGLLDEWIKPTAGMAEIEIAGLKYQLELGSLNPVDDAVGVQSRLQNLGLYDGELDGDVGPLTKDAIAEFRGISELEPGEDIDDEFRQALVGLTDEEHETPAEQPSSDQELAETDDGDDDDDLDKGDGSSGEDDDENDMEIDPESEDD